MPSVIAIKTCATRLPPNSCSTFVGTRNTCRASAASLSRGRIARRTFGIMTSTAVAITPAITIASTASLLMSIETPRSDRVSVPKPASQITSNRNTSTTKPARLSTSPTATAGDVASPARWKKRTLSATRPAELGTASAMNRIANCNPITGPRRNGRGHAPNVENASEIQIDWEKSSAPHSQMLSACWSSSRSEARPTCEIAVMIAHAANTTTSTMSADPRVTRRSGSSFGTSVSAAAAVALRRSSSRVGDALRPARIGLVRAADWRNGSMVARPSIPSAVRAASIARVGPTWSAVVTSNWARSVASWAGLAAAAARLNVPIAAPPSDRTTRCRSSSAPWAIPASCNEPIDRQAWPRYMSVIASSSRSATGSPSASSTMTASSSAIPAARTGKTGTPARSASSVRNASCSTSRSRLSVRKGASSRYQR